jgi:hypothetical protein
MIAHILPDSRFIEIISKYKQNKENKKEKFIISWAGGGTCGGFQIGVAIRLAEIGVLQLSDAFTGTSVGGLNATLVSKYIDNISSAEKVWLGIRDRNNLYEREINGYTIIFQALTKSESVLYPKGLYNIFQKEFINKSFNDYKIPVTVTATDIDIADVDGGVGNNSSMDVAIDLGVTKSIIIGCFPDRKTSRQKRYSGTDKVIPALKRTSALPILFPAQSDKGNKVSFVDVAKNMLQPMLEIYEEKNWEIYEWYDKLSKLDNIQYPSIEMIGIYPDDTLHDVLDCTKTESDISKGYQKAVEIFTPEALDIFLNS